MSGFISDTLSSVQENIVSKIKSPLYGAFAFSWVVCNWKPVSIFILSKDSVYERINNVSAYASLENQLYYPVMAAVILVLAVPALHALYAFFDAFISSIHDSAGNLREKFNQKNRTRALVAKVEAEMAEAKTRARYEVEIAKAKEEAAEFNLRAEGFTDDLTTIESLKEELREARTQIDDLGFQLRVAQNAIGNPGFRKD
ncbi:TPA: hypothetical protein I3599_001355 [Enterobacter cloacae]|nr:hypothetical protein [Enterobacter cloacae]